MPLRRRRPLLRAAAVGGSAYLAGKSRGAHNASQTQDTSQGRDELSPATIDRLQQLGDLHDRGVLTDEEFAAQKSRLLNQ
jgi:hypothetical protein